MSVGNDQKLQIQQATDIVRLIGEQISLQPKGKEFVGLCPFHNDKRPSLSVSPAKQIYKCFACSAGGDVFSFVMNYHKMTFPETLKYLAERAGIKLESAKRSWGEQAESATDRQQIVRANELAVRYYASVLKQPDSRVARDYIQQRGISAAMVEVFQIGYAPDQWDGLSLVIGQRGWDRRGFELAGLISQRKQGNGHYDRLRHRLIFPILDALGRPVAFGGRRIREEDEPKYLNSPETLLFNKSATLYGLHAAKKAIIDSQVAVIVEGYTDVIACHQAGLTNVVATLGTALTQQHIHELRRYADRAVLIFDADEAGQNAADRAVEIFLSEQLDVAIAILPNGQDPAQLLQEGQQQGVERWNTVIEDATDALEYQFNRLRREFEAAQTITGRQNLAQRYLQRLAQLGLHRAEPVRLSLVIQQLSALLRMPANDINRMLKRLSKPSAPPRTGTNASSQTDPLNPQDEALVIDEFQRRILTLQLAERQLIGCLLRNDKLFHHTLPDGRTLNQAITPAELISPPASSLYQMIHELLTQGKQVSLSVLLVELAERNDQKLIELTTTAHAEVEAALNGHEPHLEALLANTVQTILDHHRQQQYRQTREALATLPRGDDQSSTGADEDVLLRKIAEQTRAQASPARIARVGSSS